MKRSVVLKTVAILLCAASLLGTLASISGFVAFSGLGLNGQTAAQYIESAQHSSAGLLADDLLRRYASEALGNCPPSLVEEFYPRMLSPYSGYDTRKMGYTILDTEGNLLAGYQVEKQDSAAKTLRFQPNTQYLYLASSAPLIYSENGVNYDWIPWNLSDDEPGHYVDGSLYAQDQLIYGLHLGMANGSTMSVGSDSPIGITFLQEDGSRGLRCFDRELLRITDGNQAIRLAFLDQDCNVVEELYNPAGVGVFSYNPQGELRFSPNFSVLSTRDATEPETLPPTEPEVTEAPTEETLPPEPTEPETYDIFRLELKTDDDTMVYGLKADAPIGTIHYDKKGYLVFEALEELPEGYREEGSAEDASFDKAFFWSEKREDDGYDFFQELDDGWISVHSGILTYRSEEVLRVPVETEPPVTEAPTEPEATEPPTEETVATLPTQPAEILVDGRSISEYQSFFYDYPVIENGKSVTYRGQCVNLQVPDYTVELYLEDGFFTKSQAEPYLYLLESVRGFLLPVLLAGILLLVVTTVYLCCAAGHGVSDEIQAGGLNRLPLDVYFCLAFTLVVIPLLILGETGGLLFLDPYLVVGLVGGLCYLYCLLLVGFCFAFVAQIKTRGGYWWRNLLCARIVLRCWNLAKKVLTLLIASLLPGCWKRGRAIWKKGFTRLENSTKRLVELLPLTWQWMLTACILLFLCFLVAIGFAFGSPGMVILFSLPILGIFYLSARAFAILRDGAKRMSEGELNTKVNTRYLLGCFKSFAEDLNKLASVAVVAAQKQLRSDRMKTELITNVSHDIKTPLTSIINYVDLLEKPHTEEEGAEYLAVLNRQSQRLKKLIEDLMDMSKASTGNMSVDISTVDVVESVNQALGEFSDKLTKAQLSPLFRHSESSVLVQADGKLLWRVLSNLLGNAVKYALPGTRVYIDLMTVEGQVTLSVKNISREQLNINAEELMERFVRGDDSRNTEGSGLGLNIAKSLMELQHGQMELLVDGDLFKVTLIFPEDPFF